MKNNDNRQLRRLRSEVEHICKEQHIELSTKSKRRSCSQYIKELISKLRNREKSNVHHNFSINPRYTEMANDKNNKYSMFIKQTTMFESTMTQLSYKRCDICHQRRLKIIVTDGVCSRCIILS